MGEKALKNTPDRGVVVSVEMRYYIHCKDELTSKVLQKIKYRA